MKAVVLWFFQRKIYYEQVVTGCHLLIISTNQRITPTTAFLLHTLRYWTCFKSDRWSSPKKTTLSQLKSRTMVKYCVFSDACTAIWARAPKCLLFHSCHKHLCERAMSSICITFHTGDTNSKQLVGPTTTCSSPSCSSSGLFEIFPPSLQHEGRAWIWLRTKRHWACQKSAQWENRCVNNHRDVTGHVRGQRKEIPHVVSRRKWRQMHKNLQTNSSQTPVGSLLTKHCLEQASTTFEVKGSYPRLRPQDEGHKQWRYMIGDTREVPHFAQQHWWAYFGSTSNYQRN